MTRDATQPRNSPTVSPRAGYLPYTMLPSTHCKAACPILRSRTRTGNICFLVGYTPPALLDTALEPARGHEPQRTSGVGLEDEDHRALMGGCLLVDLVGRGGDALVGGGGLGGVVCFFVCLFVGSEMIDCKLVDGHYSYAWVGLLLWGWLGKVVDSVVEVVWCAHSFVGPVVSGEPHSAMAWAGLSLPLSASVYKFPYSS